MHSTLLALFLPAITKETYLNMKKLLSFFAFAAIAMTTLSLTSCDDDEIARTLEGTWEGVTESYRSYSGHDYQSTRTLVHFSRNPYKYAAGEGYWVDYFNTHPWGDWDYVANHINWDVTFECITIHFIEDNYTVEIWDYRLNDGYFEGQIRDHGRRINFRFAHTSSPNWGSGWHWGYGGYAPEGQFDEAETRAADAEKSQRYFGKK